MENKPCTPVTYISEKLLERKLSQWCKDVGGKSVKLTGVIGIPDRLLVLPFGVNIYVEVKTTGKAPRKAQLIWAAELERRGQTHFFLDSLEGLKKIKDAYKRLANEN